MPEDFTNNAVDAFYEDQEGELSLMERTALARIREDHFLREMVKRMMVWSYEQGMHGDNQA